MNDVIRQKLKDLPQSPGVYIMSDVSGTVIYVGKAVNLKNRVSQYFHTSVKTEKTMKLVENIVDFRYIICATEEEALVLENNLIKKYAPKYNILLKDDKQYPFIKINVKEKFPSVQVVRKLVDDGSKYFGPYMVGVNTKDILELIGSAFPVRSCNKDLSHLPSSHRPCLMSHIGRCLAPCSGNVTREEYGKVISDVISFLKGNDEEIKKVIEKKMYDASAREDFESALYFKNRLHTLDKLIRQQIAALPKDYNMDVFSVLDNGVYTAVSVLMVRGGKLVGGDNYPVESINSGLAKPVENAENTTTDELQLNRNLLEQFILQYYDNMPDVADEIVVNTTLPSENALLSVLSDKFDKKLNIIVPQRGIRKQLVEMAENNAKNYLETFVVKQLKKYNLTEGAVQKLQEILRLPSPPARMECFDISHFSGTDVVASMTVFQNGEPKKSAYRRFKVKVQQNNDFESMHETLLRRLSKIGNSEDESFNAHPDLIVIDGGKGQLSRAQDAMREAGVYVNMISLAESDEIIYFPDKSEGLYLSRRSPALALLMRLRDEAHRFAVDYATRLHTNRLKVSSLKDIEGIGDKKTDILYNHFKTIDRIKAASVDTLAAVKGISRSDAEKIRAFFDGKNQK